MLYFDHSATTPLHPDVLELMTRVSQENFGNPSSIHSLGQSSRAVIELARRQMAKAINSKPLDIIFTGGGTEANNIVLWSLIHGKKKHAIISSIEHPAVYKTLQFLKPFGVMTTEVPVDKSGIVNPADIEKNITEETGLVSIMLANNEVGSIQPLKEISQICKRNGIHVHSDAVQALGKIPVDVIDLGLDYLSFSAHKFYGPKGVGVLYARSTKDLKGLLQGGGQERKLRAGTENVAGIAGLGLAAELCTDSIKESSEHISKLAEEFCKGLEEHFPDAIINGEIEKTLPGLVNVSFPKMKSDMLMIHLNRAGISVSTGSACSSGSISPSHVLKAMGISNDLNTRTLRVSFGRDNTSEDVKTLLEALNKSINTSSRFSR